MWWWLLYCIVLNDLLLSLLLCTSYLLSGEMEACRAASCQVDLPRVYVVYKLEKGHIDIDGKLDERAWQDVAWTESFVGR